MADLKITEEMRGIINQCRFEDLKVYLPEGQLDRKLYVKINALLEECGGSWNRKLKCHLFASDPREKLGVIVEQEKLIDKQKKFQSFYTPHWLVEKVVKMVNVKGRTVLEPSCGDGRFIRECFKQGAVDIDAVELNEEQAEAIMPEFFGKIAIHVGDFLKFNPAKEECFLPEYDIILGNPPYSRTDWLKHSLHAYQFVKPGGKLVFILPNSIHSNKKFQDFVVDKRWEYEKVKAKTFEDTNIETNIVIIYK